MANYKKSEMMIPDEVQRVVLTTEREVMSAAMNDQRAADIVFARLSERDLLDNLHREVYRATLSLYLRGQELSNIAVIQELANRGRLDIVGGEVAVMGIDKSYITTENLEKNIEHLREHAVRRRLAEYGQYVSATALETGDIQDLLNRNQALFDRIADFRETDVAPISASTDDAVKMLVNSIGTGDRVSGITLGWRDVDKYLGGLQPGEVLLVGGATGMGKTAFALNAAKFVAVNQQKPVVILSLEMTREQLTKRLLCSIGGVPSVDLRYTKKEQAPVIEKKLLEAKRILDASKLFIIDRIDMSISDIAAECKRLKHQNNGLGLIVIDYLQLIKGSPEARRSGNRALEVSEISRSLKTMALSLKTPIMELTQLNRGVDATQSKRPTLAHIKESSSVPQDADKIILLFRQDYYRDQEGSVEPRDNIVDVIIAKNRDGSTGNVKLFYKADTTTLLTLAKEDMPEVNKF